VSRGRSREGSGDGPEGGRERLVGDLGREMQRLVSEVVLFNQAVGDRLGMNPTDLQCLNVLMRAGPLAAGRLAEETGLTKGAVTGVIDRLERAGYVWRGRDPADGRRVIVHPIREKAGRDIGPVYASISRRFAEMCERYDEEELALILDFVGRSHPLNREETARLRAEAAGGSAEGGGFSAPLGSAASGRLVFERGASAVEVRADPAMEELVRVHFEGPEPKIRERDGTVTVRQRRRRSWALGRGKPAGVIALNAAIPWGIEVRGGAAGLDADLGALALESFEIKGGASGTVLALPRPSGMVALRVLGGASGLAIRRPEGVGVRVFVGAGAHSLTLDGQGFEAAEDETRWQSPDYAGATDRYDIEISGGVSGLTIDTG
jgi:DNA-binding MarR family transcriptional regulator